MHCCLQALFNQRGRWPGNETRVPTNSKFTDRRTSFLEDGGGGNGIRFIVLGLLPFCLQVSSEGGGEPHKLHVHGVGV